MMALNDYVLRFARECEFKDNGGQILQKMRAFICPLRYKNKMYLYGVNTEIGFNPEGYYLYIGPANVDLDYENTYIQCGDNRYIIDRNEKVYLGEKVLYIWAIIRKMVEIENECD